MYRLLLPFLLAAGPAAAAPGFQDSQSLDRAVAAFTGRPIGSEGGARSMVDSRLRLAICPTLALSWRTDSHDAVVVNCTGPEWRVFVPVNMAASTPAQSAGTVTAARIVRVEPVIRRGDLVTISTGSDGFSITRDGVAMAEAPPGGRFAVQVGDNRAMIQAVAVAPGEARLPGAHE